MSQSVLPRSFARLRFVASAFLLGRAAVLAVIVLALRFVPARTPNANQDFVAFPGHLLWDALCRWDSGWYDRVARLGYVGYGGGQSDVAFFPLFPLLSRWLAPVFGGHWAAGLVVANVGFLVGLGFLSAIARRYAGDDGARRAVLMALVFPPTIFASAYYSEGLFFGFATACLFFYERRSLAAAGALGGLAAMTRGAGVLLFPALLLGELAREGFGLGARPARLAWLLLVPLGLGVVMAMQAKAVGDPLAFVQVQAAWGRSGGVSGPAIAREVARLEPREVMDVLDVAATLGLFAVAAVAYRRLDLAHAVFALGCVLVPLASGQVKSMERYAASVPAAFLVLSLATRNRWALRGVFSVSGGLMVVQTMLFARGYWAG